MALVEIGRGAFEFMKIGALLYGYIIKRSGCSCFGIAEYSGRCACGQDERGWFSVFGWPRREWGAWHGR